MSSVVHSTAHGFVAGDRFYFGNVLPEFTGIVDGQVYYVLAAGLTANDFTFSETAGGTAVVLALDVTECIVSKAAVYTAVTDPDDVHAPPIAPSAPGSCVLSSAAVLAPDGTTVARLDITITQPTSATLRHTVVTITGGSNTVKVIIPVGQTTGSVASVVPGVAYTGSAVAYDTFGLASSATVSAAHTAAGDVTAPSVPTGLAASGAILGIVASWTAVSNVDLSHYELAISTDGGGTFPTIIKTKSTLISVGELSAGVKTIKVRAVDLTGNTSAYTATTTATSRLTDLVTNSTAEVTIDATGLTVLNGAIFIKDAAGNSVLTASGFGGSWLDFLSSGLIYNALFRSGDTSDIAITEVGTGNNLSDYTASAVQAHLPYWVVSGSGGTVKIVTDTVAPSGKALEMSGSASQVNRIYQDIPFPSATAFDGLVITLSERITVAFGNAADKFRIYGSYRDINHVLLGSRVLISDLSGPFSTDTTYGQVSILTSLTIGAVPDSTAFVRYEVEITHFTSGSTIRLGAVRCNRSDLIIQELTAAEGGSFGADVLIAANLWLTGGSALDVAIYKSATATLQIDTDGAGGFMSGGVNISGGLTLGATNDANEGGQINLDGQGANTDWSIDNYTGDLRFFHGATVALTLDNAGGTHALLGGFLVTGAVNTSTTPASWTAAVIVDNAATSTNTILQFNVAGTRRGSIRVDSGGNTVLNGSGTGGVFLNHDEGSGAVNVGSGKLSLGSSGTYDTYLRRSAAKVLMLDSDGAGTTATAFDGVGALFRGFSGTSFPGSPATNDRFRRTDISGGMWFFYDGTRWLSEVLFETAIVPDPTVTWPFAATASRGVRFSVPALRGGSDIYLVQHEYNFFVNGGTALGASHKWVGTLDKTIAANTVTTIVTDNINSGASSSWRTATDAINALQNNGTTHYELSVTWTKTGTPGNLFVYHRLSYRIVAT